MVVSILYVPTVNQMVISEQHHLRFIISDRRTVVCFVCFSQNSLLTLKFHVWNTLAIAVLNWLCCGVYFINGVKRLHVSVMPHCMRQNAYFAN